MQASKKFVHPVKAGRKARWSAAAAIVIGIMAAILVLQDARKQREFVVEDPQKAYEVTRRALLLVSSGLNEGKTYSTELKKLHEAEQIIKEKKN